MTGNPNCQIWLTSALTESDVPKALTLCFSLKRVLTCRKVGVITSRQLPSHLIESLRQGFEYLFFLEDGRNSAGLKEQDFIKLFPLTLKPFEMCVFLSPTMLAVQNCDKIFEECCSQRFSGYLLTEGTGMDVFVIKPSPRVFENLMKVLVETNGLGTENYIRAWVDTNNEACKLLTSNYNLILSAQSLPQSGGEKDVLIVNTRNLRLDMNIEELGLFTKVPAFQK
ncbi:unnamed protein product [Orchesella dallaii]|uniref:Uncharacterized protein n=1 Tax=Orchesella dallaii TaxID=48710 RepID=A0ABP1Q6Y9_9HEXA